RRDDSGPLAGILAVMPELPDVTVYVDALNRYIVGKRLTRVRVRSPFLVRTFDPPLDSVEGKTVREIGRLGQRIAIGVDVDVWIVSHLMIAGRLHWKPPGAGITAKVNLAAFDFPDGTLLLTEAGSKHRASLHVVPGRDSLQKHNPGGLDVFAATPAEFNATL